MRVVPARPWALVLALAASAAALAALPPASAADHVVERRTPTGSAYEEFLPEWRSGPAEVAYRSRTLPVPEGARYATDGESWLYVVNASGSLERPPWGCGDPEGNETTGTWALVPPGECLWWRHPAEVVCWDVPACERDLAGVNRAPYVPPPTTTFGPTPASQLTPTCGRVPGAMCTPAAPLGGVLALVAAAALTWRARGRGPA